MDWMLKVVLWLLVMGAGMAAESWIIYKVYRLGRVDGWDAAYSAHEAWKGEQKADAA